MAEKKTMYLEVLRRKIVAQEQSIKDFKRELQRLYAPKVKIILQIITLQDESLWRSTGKDSRANVDRAKQLLKDVFYLGEKVLDDSFFKTFMRNFEPVFQSEVASMTQKVMTALNRSQLRKGKKGGPDSDTPPSEDQISSFHRVVSISDL